MVSMLMFLQAHGMGPSNLHLRATLRLEKGMPADAVFTGRIQIPCLAMPGFPGHLLAVQNVGTAFYLYSASRFVKEGKSCHV